MDTTSNLQMNSLLREAEQSPVAPNGTTEQTILQPFARFRQNPLDFSRELYLFVRGVDWRSYDKQIGQPVFYSGYTAKIRNTVMASPLLRKKLNELVEERLAREVNEQLLDGDNVNDKSWRSAEITSSLEEYAGLMVDKMMCKMESKFQIRSAFYMCTQLLTRVYSGVHVSQQEVEKLREVATRAAAQKKPIVFLPRHTSHIDYVALQLICYRLGITLPVVVAGENLNFPVVGPFLQHRGAMWIRRSFDGDALYRTLVQAYLDSMMQQGYNLECFIEGGRSRTGKLLQPKFGFLGFLLDSVLSGRTEDAYICPVSMQYDKVIEVDSYVTEMLGKPKQKENLTDFLSSSSILGMNMGRVDCRFHEPWSLREFIDAQLARTNAVAVAQDGVDKTKPEVRTRLLRTLGYKVLADINDVSVVMPTALVGTVLLTLRGRGVGRSELARRVEWLCDRIPANGGNVADFHGMPTLEVVDRALAVLGSKLVGTIDSVAEETYYAVDRFQLSFYRNATIHLFISEALIAVSLYTKVKQGGGRQAEQIPEKDLAEQVAFMSQLTRGEFIFRTGQGLEHNFREALDGLVKNNVLELTDGDDRTIGLAQAERQSGREDFDFYCFLIWPFIDAAWLGAVSLLCLVPTPGSAIQWIDMKRAQAVAQTFGRTLYHQGDLSYFEAINTEAIKNAYSRFQEEGIIRVANGAGKGSLSVQIAPDWMPYRHGETGMLQPTGRLWEFTDKISQHRREGKNRRDGATVSTRVLKLASKLNEDLFNELESTSEDESPAQVRKSQRRRSRL
ncbi:hypothetical protein LTR70_009113 [Exophiala xenobiotica]|uniref:Phospholipid/glycerol acyltransferase domain-containing protein n=1 Tax=Lithohypha guttulata TaxID=1690604 RepID=A0ABR0JYX3_9EURO|nr:hypothetical protein LTR24_008805 [Lithohypha guttulata]KAK5310988.1 hypothetical protein LTR70_009113 [Exophiala xenobiotica]